MNYTLKQWRMLRDMTQGELAEAIGKSVATVWSWEKGKTEPKASDLSNLRTALKLKDTDVIVLP